MPTKAPCEPMMASCSPGAHLLSTATLTRALPITPARLASVAANSSSKQGTDTTRADTLRAARSFFCLHRNRHFRPRGEQRHHGGKRRPPQRRVRRRRARSGSSRRSPGVVAAGSCRLSAITLGPSFDFQARSASTRLPFRRRRTAGALSGLEWHAMLRDARPADGSARPHQARLSHGSRPGRRAHPSRRRAGSPGRQ